MGSRIRVLQFITPAGFYGAERWVLALANNLNPETVTCDLAVTRESDHQDLSVAEYFPTVAGQVHYLPMRGRFDWRVVSQLVCVIKEREIDVVHTHGYKSDILGYLAARRAGVPCMSTPHGFAGKVDLKLATFIRLGMLVLRRFDAVVPLSEELQSDMRRFRVPAERTHFVRNGVDLKDIDRELSHYTPAEKTSKRDQKTIGFIGQMIPRKGIPDLLSAFDQLRSEDQALRLQLVGDGHQRSELESIVANGVSRASVEFLGFRSDRLQLLKGFDLFVMTSSLEGIPRCMMEAMAVGVPVVAYDIPGVDQLVEHGRTGMLAPHGDKAALADCCRQVLTNPDFAASLAANARRHIEEQYSAGRMAREYEVLFESLVANQRTVSGVSRKERAS
ncbi:glycosyltransferase family 4 protein [Marinobacter bryozoorum]|uniref:glycosyltransferase family 4 protein n=1 Tax=Marinobacter bryozoorum TaxID=256324 RepID=UPI0020062A20|nr:glycosyltransferase family 4 protein [Marinobacter bryozoorum]MCK7544029.1 glycosyltransferase family 4 protein [Marinobacter bryozoorum]